MEWNHLYIAIFCIALPLANSQNYRLPETVIPSKYVIDIFVPEGAFIGQNNTFEGEVTMSFTVQSNTSEIKLHHRSTILQVVISSPMTELTISNMSYDSTTEIFTISLPIDLTINTNYNLYIKYSGILAGSDTMNGLYISSYKNENNQTSYLVLTQFEPVHSRHGFPCLDEPQYKATFDLSLTYPNGLNALANTPEVNSTVLQVGSTSYTKTIFEETTLMSTYLVAFVISSFTCTEGSIIADKIPYRVCSRLEAAADRAWAVEIGTTLMATMENITGIKYGSYMNKLDQVAIPDFNSGAMENWGLVTYREIGLLWSEEDSSNIYKMNTATLIAHELSHSWFGNLVTCKWWDYTFLNEGLARFYEYFGPVATNQLVDWEMDKLFNVEVVQEALLEDSFSDALALTSVVSSPSDIAEKFQEMDYSKGSSILRMIEENIMGPDNFVRGIREYITTYAQKDVVPANLWSSLANHVPSNTLPFGVDLSTTLNNWVELPGHPVVIVTKSRDDIVLSQERFLISGNDTVQYYVPITYTVSSDVTSFGNTTVNSWMTPGQSLTLSGVLSGSDWIVLNNRQAGFYRVDYDSTLWAALKTQLETNHLEIDVLNRAQLISDAYNFAKSGVSAGYGTWVFSDLLDILSYLEHEEDYYPWYATIVGNNDLLQSIGYDSEVGKQFTTWMLGLMKSVNNTVTFDKIDNSNQIYTMKQVLILKRTCRYGDAYCVSKSKELFSNYRDNGIKVPKNLKELVYCYALKHSDDVQSDFNFLWQKYTETQLMTDILTIFSGLTCAQDTTVLKWLLDQTINSTSGIRSQDFTTVWSFVADFSKIGTNSVIEYITDNYAKITTAYSDVGGLISDAASYIYDEDQLEKLEALASVSGISSSDKATTEDALSTAKENLAWAAKVTEDIKIYLQSKAGAK